MIRIPHMLVQSQRKSAIATVRGFCAHTEITGPGSMDRESLQAIDVVKIFSYSIYLVHFPPRLERKMMTSSAHDKALSGILQDPPSCWWKFPNKETTVLLDMTIVERINGEIKGAADNGIHKKEVGGLLLGTIACDPALRISVTECLPVRCTHELGPAFRLSHSDRISLWSQINRYWVTHGKLQHILSFYRSNNSPDFQITGADLALARDFIPDSLFILLIKPSSPTNIGALIIPGETQTRSERRLLFPFDKDKLLSGQTILKDGQEDTPDTSSIMIADTPPAERLPRKLPIKPRPTSSLQPRLRIESAPERKRSGSPWLWNSVMGLLVFALAGGIFYKFMKTESVSNAPPQIESAADLGLEARQERAPSTRLPAASTETADLASSELTSAKGPSQQGDGIPDSTNLAGTPKSPVPAADLQSRSLPKVMEEAKTIAKSSAPTGPMNKPQRSIDPSLSTAPDTGTRPPVSSATVPDQKDPSARPQREGVASQPSPDQVIPAAPLAETVLDAMEAAAKPKPDSPVAGSADAAQKAGSPASSPEISQPADVLVPPQPIEALSPILLPPGLQSRLPESMQVGVRVYVDATGIVIGAKSLSKDAQISGLAVNAVRQMRFIPARRGNQHIASDLIINLEFVRRVR
jgi:protein TonB